LKKGIKMKLHIQCLSEITTEFYTSHKTHHEGDSGFDLFFPEDIVILPGESKIVDLQIKIRAEQNGEMSSYLLVPRSSISKTPLRMSNSIGIMDKLYRGPIKVCIDNIKNQPYNITKGDRLFQIVSCDLLPIIYTIVSKLDETSRGVNGLGSTGK
jgi:dUTP pyrophosphatase